MTELIWQTFPDPVDLRAAVDELCYSEPIWAITLTDEDRGQDCVGLTLSIYPDKRDSYHPDRHVHTVFTYPVPAAHFNRESWEEWLWDCITDCEGHERAEGFKFRTTLSDAECLRLHGQGCMGHEPTYRRPFKPAHADGWNPGTVRTVVSDTVTNTPNAGRLVQIPCGHCPHHHGSRMGEHFTVASVGPCSEDGCDCPWRGKVNGPDG